jgi:hypothetical protein
MKAELPPDLRRFVLTSVPSVPYLEAVLLLRSSPDTAWQAAQLASRLYLPERQAAELLRTLAEGGVARERAAGAIAYGPSTPELAGLIDRLAQEYAANLMAVTDLIHSRVDKRAQQFADAFRWRKDNNN